MPSDGPGEFLSAPIFVEVSEKASACHLPLFVTDFDLLDPPKVRNPPRDEPYLRKRPCL